MPKIARFSRDEQMLNKSARSEATKFRTDAGGPRESNVSLENVGLCSPTYKETIQISSHTVGLQSPTQLISSIKWSRQVAHFISSNSLSIAHKNWPWVQLVIFGLMMSKMLLQCPHFFAALPYQRLTLYLRGKVYYLSKCCLYLR